MEFYAYGWTSWGTKEEIGYFLPRLMEYLLADINRLSYPGLFGLFKYKLKNLFSESNTDWTTVEKESLRKFLMGLFENHFSKSVDIGMAIECALALDMPPQDIFDIWKFDQKLYVMQIYSVSKHFKVPMGIQAEPQGLYFEGTARIASFFDLLNQRLERKMREDHSVGQSACDTE